MDKDQRNISEPSARPLDERERMHILDALRGFALLGIFVVNLFYLSGYRYFPPDQFQTAALDGHGLFWINLLAQGKFYSLFSFLFGLGFAIQMNRSNEKGQSFLPLYFRRILILLLIGLFHTFIWHGDILTVYALSAFFLIPFRNAGNKIIILAAVFLLLTPVLLEYFILKTGILPGEKLVIWGKSLKEYWQIPATSLIVSSGELKTFLLAKIPAAIFRYAYLLNGGRFFKLWGMFLIGFYFGRNKIFSNPLLYKNMFVKLFWIFGFTGIFFSVLAAFCPDCFFSGSETSRHLYKSLVSILGDHPLAIGYMAGFTLLYIGMKNNMINWLAPAGRMALTNYLMQSVIAILFFYHIGLGLGPVGPVVYLPFAFVVFVIQVLYSKWWLTYFRFGPMEWLWRCGMYGQFQPFKKQR